MINVNRCTCKPGTPENGWHEQRCDACLEQEREDWSKVFQHLKSEGLLRG